MAGRLSRHTHEVAAHYSGVRWQIHGNRMPLFGGQSGKAYRGRFAPSPTGPLHFGSLVAAVASYLDARSQQGVWLVRMEDLDRPRCVPGAADSILRLLEQCGLRWDEHVLWQSGRTPAYAAALERLRAGGYVFPCGCSRSESGTGVYPGHCRNGLPPGRRSRTWRARVPDETVLFHDRLHGLFSQQLTRDVGDFVVRRADGIFAYQLAVVVDDGEQQITDVVRGSDLLDSTPRQILLQRMLGLPEPHYLHLPLATNGKGEKLSKQTRARPASVEDLPRVLAFLNHAPPADLLGAPPDELLRWAVGAWTPSRLPTEPSPAP